MNANFTAQSSTPHILPWIPAFSEHCIGKRKVPILTDFKTLLPLRATSRAIKSDIDQYLTSWVVHSHNEIKEDLKLKKSISESEDVNSYLILFCLSLQYLPPSNQNLQEYQANFLKIIAKFSQFSDRKQLYLKIMQKAIKNLENFCKSPDRLDKACLSESINASNLRWIKSINDHNNVFLLKYSSDSFSLSISTEKFTQPFILLKELCGKSCGKSAMISLMNAEAMNPIIADYLKNTLRYLSKNEFILMHKLQHWLPFVEISIEKKLLHIYPLGLAQGLCDIAIALKDDLITTRVEKVLTTLDPWLIPSLPAKKSITTKVLEVLKTFLKTILNSPLFPIVILFSPLYLTDISQFLNITTPQL